MPKRILSDEDVQKSSRRSNLKLGRWSDHSEAQLRTMNGLEISPFIKALPKVELHVHIEGTLTPALRWELAHRNKVKLPYVSYEDLLDSWYSHPLSSKH